MLVKPGDLSAAIGRMLDSPTETQAYGQAPQERIMRDFIAPRSTRLMEAIYSEQLGTRRSVGWRPYARIARRKIGRLIRFNRGS